MRVVIDALGVQRGGGLMTTVHSLVSSWATVAPNDRLTLVIDGRVRAELPTDSEQLQIVSLDLGSCRQANRLSRAAWSVRHHAHSADAFLATLPILPTFGVGPVPAVAFVYDMRHRLRPTDFSRSTVVQRRLFYHSALRRADTLLAISQRTADDLDALLTHHAPVTVVHLGADHIPAATTNGKRSHGLVHGHFSNKGVDLALRTWATLRHEDAVDLPLVVTGVPTAERGRWESLASQLGIGKQVHIAGWLDNQAFATTLDDAAVLLFPSRHEGFGLPVLEAMRRRVPVAISPDAALVEVAQGHACVASTWTPEAMAAAVRTALSMPDVAVDAAARHAATFLWATTVAKTRAVIQQEIERR